MEKIEEEGGIILKEEIGMEPDTKKEEKSYTHLEELDKIENSEVYYEVKISLLNSLARDFISKKFHIRKDMEYGEMISYFLEKHKPEIAHFCHTMVIAMYSGERLKEDNLRILFEDFRSIIEKENKEGVLKTFFLKKIFSHKKESGKLSDTEHVNQKTSEDIEKAIKENQLKEKYPVSSNNKDFFIEKVPHLSEELIKIKGDLIPSFDKTIKKEREGEKLIENIDDLKRIKNKIEERKKQIAAGIV